LLGNFSEISAAFASAALDSSRWVEAMDVAASATNSAGAVLLPIAGRLPNAPRSERIAPMLDAYFNGGWVHRDERHRGVSKMVKHGVFTDFDFTDMEEIKRHAFYQDFLGRFGLQWFAGVKISFGDDLWCLAIQRAVQDGPFAPDELKHLSLLSNQLSSAGAVARALGFARGDGALNAFEMSGTAAALIDRRGEVLKLNVAFEQQICQDLQVVSKRIVSSSRTATAHLDSQLKSLLWNADPSSLTPPIALPLRDRRPLLAYIARLPHVTSDAMAACQAILVLVDLDRNRVPSELSLARLFKLTSAEARLAVQLASGLTIAESAGALGISYETARTQLKAIFAKTDTHRQSEVVALLGRVLSASLNPDQGLSHRIHDRLPPR